MWKTNKLFVYPWKFIHLSSAWINRKHFTHNSSDYIVLYVLHNPMLILPLTKYLCVPQMKDVLQSDDILWIYTDFYLHTLVCFLPAKYPFIRLNPSRISIELSSTSFPCRMFIQSDAKSLIKLHKIIGWSILYFLRHIWLNYKIS